MSDSEQMVVLRRAVERHVGDANLTEIVNHDQFEPTLTHRIADHTHCCLKAAFDLVSSFFSLLSFLSCLLSSLFSLLSFLFSLLSSLFSLLSSLSVSAPVAAVPAIPNGNMQTVNIDTPAQAQIDAAVAASLIEAKVEEENGVKQGQGRSDEAKSKAAGSRRFRSTKDTAADLPHEDVQEATTQAQQDATSLSDTITAELNDIDGKLGEMDNLFELQAGRYKSDTVMVESFPPFGLMGCSMTQTWIDVKSDGTFEIILQYWIKGLSSVFFGKETEKFEGRLTWCTAGVTFDENFINTLAEPKERLGIKGWIEEPTASFVPHESEGRQADQVHLHIKLFDQEPLDSDEVTYICKRCSGT